MSALQVGDTAWARAPRNEADVAVTSLQRGLGLPDGRARDAALASAMLAVYHVIGIDAFVRLMLDANSAVVAESDGA